MIITITGLDLLSLFKYSGTLSLAFKVIAPAYLTAVLGSWPSFPCRAAHLTLVLLDVC